MCFGSQLIEPGSIYSGKGHSPYLFSRNQNGIAEDHCGLACDTANLIIADGKVSSLNGALEPPSVGSVHTAFQRDAAAEYVAL